jgi:hypothetical protein
MRRALANVGLAVSSVALVLALCEVGVRLFADVGPSLLVRDPRIGKRYVAGFDGSVYVPEAGRRVRLRFQKDGFRGPDRPYRKPSGVRRIAILGDSMIVAVATAEKRTLVRRLEDMLDSDARGPAWEVLNFGVSSASPGEELVLYREVVARYDPDLVLCAFYVGNDLADNSPRLTRAPRLYFDMDEGGALKLLPFDASRSPVSEWLNWHSRFYVWQKEALSRLRNRLKSASGRTDPALLVFLDRQPEDPDVAHAWALTSRIVGETKREVEGRGASFAMVLLPSAEQIYDDLWQAAVRSSPDGPAFRRDNPERRMGEICREAGVPLVTMADAFRAAAPRASSADRDEWLFCLGRYHFNDAGNSLAARVIASSLARLGGP